jgi:photosystem II stability/assembly factor-like uncharacterized protein
MEEIMKHRSFFFCSLLAVLLAFLTVQPAYAVDPVPMWLWRQPPHDPRYFYPPRPPAEVVAWGGVDKTVIYAATTDVDLTDMAHGLYRSKDQGDSWEYLGKVDEDEYITQLVVHPTKPEIMFAGFNRNYYRGGIYRSDDGGESWTSVLPYLPVVDIEIDPSHPNIMYATGWGTALAPVVDGGIYKSTDEGKTWEHISTLSPWIPDVAVHPTSSNILFAVSDWGGVYRSNDAGVTWQQISDIQACRRILINQNNPNQMFLSCDDGVWRTDDGGQSWTDTTSDLPSVLGYTMIQTAELDPNDPNTIWVGLKYDGMYVSHDSGDHWEHVSYGIFYVGAGIYGPQCTSSDIANGKLIIACSGMLYVQGPDVSLAGIRVDLGETNRGDYIIPVGFSARASYRYMNYGPVKIEGTQNILAAEQVVYKVNGVNTSFTEMMGLQYHQLDTTYWLPWYNNRDLDTQLRFANASAATATVQVFIGTSQVDTFNLAVRRSTRRSFPGINHGPVKIVSSVPIVVSERVIYKVNGVNTSFSEMMALPNKQLDTTYWLPWYNNKDLDTQLRFANVTDQPAIVHVFVGTSQVGTFDLPAGESTRKSFAGVNGGPVKIVSNVPVVVAERVIYKVNGVNTSFSEMMALPDSQLDTTYWLPWYNNVDLDTQLRFANTTDQAATVHVLIGGQEMPNSPFTLFPGESTRQSFVGINSGPVQIVSDVPIVVAGRVIYKVNNVNTSFSEMMGLPASQLDTLYWLPWYNNVDLDTQLRFGPL